MTATAWRVSALAIAAGTLFVAGLGAACGGGREAEPARQPVATAPALSASARELVALLPASGAVTGWGRTRDPQVFGAGNLWEYIDGAAETYLAFGVQDTATAGYTSASGLDATIDIFRMADATGAFGIYQHEVNPGAEFLPVGTEGYLSTNVLNFWKGRDYVKVTALGLGSTVAVELRALADHVAGAVPESGTVPREVGFFPPANLVPHSIKYVPRDLLGQSYLGRGFEAEYRDVDPPLKVATVAFDTPGAAREALGRYEAFVTAGGQVRSRIPRPGDGGFVGDQSFYGRVAVVQSGSRLVFVLGGRSDTANLALVNEFLAQAARSQGEPG